MTAAAQAADHADGVLHLAGGDFVVGRFVASPSPTIIEWQGSQFAAPFRFSLSDVNSVVFPQPEELPQATGEFCFELSHGGVIYGELAGVSEDVIVVKEPKFGRLSIRRDHLRRLFRWKSGNELLHVGPNGLDGWHDGGVPGKWREEGSHIATDQPGARLTRDFNLPAQTALEIELNWMKRPNFVFAMGVSNTNESIGQAFRLEVIDSDLVAVRETKRDADIAVVTPVGPAEGHVHLLIYLDQQRGRLLVYSMTGSLLADLNVAEAKPEIGGSLALINVVGDLQLQRLRISRWNGVPPTSNTGAEPRFQQAGGKARGGRLVGFDAERQTLTFRDGDGEISAPIADIDDVLLATGAEEPAIDLSRNAHLSYQDGTRISGELLSTGDTQIVLKSPEFLENVSAPLAELRGFTVLLDKPHPGAATRGSGTLELPETRLHGQLLNGLEAADASCLVWKPLASETAGALRKDVSGRIVYRVPAPKTKAVVRPANINRRRAQVKMLDVGKLVEPGKPARPAKAAAKADINEDCMLHLRSGDTIPCDVKSIDERGVTFETSMSDATFVPHEKVKAIELVKSKSAPKIDKRKRDRLLMLPRMQRDSPPTQLIISRSGDFLRGRVLALHGSELLVEVRLDERRIPRNRIAQVIWLHDDELGGDELGGDKLRDDEPRDDDAEEPQKKADDETLALRGPLSASEVGRGSPDPAPGTRIQVQRSDGIRLTFFATEFQDATLSGRSDVLGECRSALSQVDQLLIGDAIEQAAASLAWHRWKLHHAIDPKFVQEENNGGDPGEDSPLVGKPAPDFTLEFLNGEKFHLADCKGQVVVLDFWATWCGPCLQVMPQVEEVVGEFPSADVRLVAVNLEESPKQITATLERHKLNVAVVLDQDGVVAHRYQANAIPQTVIVDRDGKVARLFIGGGPDYADQLREALKAVLDGKPETEPAADAPADAEPGK